MSKLITTLYSNETMIISMIYNNNCVYDPEFIFNKINFIDNDKKIYIVKNFKITNDMIGISNFKTEIKFVIKGNEYYDIIGKSISMMNVYHDDILLFKIRYPDGRILFKDGEDKIEETITHYVHNVKKKS